MPETTPKSETQTWAYCRSAPRKRTGWCFGTFYLSIYPYANHGAGIFTYKTGSFMGQMLVNIPAPWSIWDIVNNHPKWRTPWFFRGVGLNHQPEEIEPLNITEKITELWGHQVRRLRSWRFVLCLFQWGDLALFVLLISYIYIYG